jgi:cobalt-precorrin-5B (C1)-methyltransferase
VAVGEPAINPVPRAMMRQAVAEVRAAWRAAGNADPGPGFDLTIGCADGEALARRTYNPRLGVIGGISILGTTGIVEPMSLAAWSAAVEVYVRVALATAGEPLVLLPGKIGRAWAKESLALPEKSCVQIANFLGDALDYTQATLAHAGRRLPILWIAGHPGKLAKVVDGVWDTHSRHSDMAMMAVARVADLCGYGQKMVAAIGGANTVEAVLVLLKDDPDAHRLWREIERLIAMQVAARVPLVDRVEVRLFDLAGRPLGAAG